ncbi:uncharacterized protein EDB91DRAFT_1145196 [Suillus paluster]|uniref:uncharacterized protein n=1 Tax=Suillus paluster TaxID=48578 RepID=UPI001B877A25|nr:uncharacterized protein EDB91DRAFT_1145196 [Suillus paluster]KAG1735096.1 hypothetical protein EDB91DRAFT_1145196 [Suillus paluster]
MVDAPNVRIVPGASPAVSLAKTQKKKRRSNKPKTADSPAEGSVILPEATSATLVDRAPEEADVKEGTVAPEVVAPSEAPTFDDLTTRSSPVVELLQKRLKALNKKISRVTSYASTDYEKLNDDQKRTLKTLPSLEAVQKELEDVKKLIESHEADLARELAARRADTGATEAARIADAVAAAEASSVSKASAILSLIHLHTCLSNRQPLPVVLDFNDAEGEAIFSLCSTLISEESEFKQAAVSGLLSGEGAFDGVSYARLLDIVQSFLNPPREPTPLPAEPDAATEVSSEPASNSQTESQPLAGIPAASGSLSGAGSFRFMQASELETTDFENTAEWVEKSEIELTHNGVLEHAESTPSAAEGDGAPTQPIDWAEADEEGGLPSIANLQASFAPSGSATPVVETADVSTPAPVNGVEAAAAIQSDDGFTQSRGRGRGRGYRGEGRGGRGGGFRGERGGYRGERGGFRGGNRGGERGGYRSDRGGRSDGEWRSDENRGRGRGRGRGHRGGDRGDRGGDRGDRGDRGGDRGGYHEGRGAPPS